MPVLPALLPGVPGPLAGLRPDLGNPQYAGRIWATNLETENIGEVFTGGLGNASFDTARSHSGAQSVKITQTGTSSQATRTLSPGSVWVGRFWFNPDTITLSAVQNLVIISHPLVTLVPTLRMSTAGVLQFGFATGTFQSGPTALLNTWQSIDFRINMGPSVHTIDWMVNGAAQTQAVSPAGALDETVGLFRVNSAGNNTLNWWYDEFQLSTDYGAYPLPDLPAITTTPRSVSDTGLTETDTVATIRLPAVSDTGVTQSDSVATTRLRAVSDTGISETDSVAAAHGYPRAVTDTGTTQTDSVATTRVRVVADTGVSETDSVVTTRARAIADTGVSETDSVAATRGFQRTISDIGISETDTVATTRARAVTDTGETQTDSVSTKRLRAVTDTGLVETDTVATVRVRVIVDTGVSETDAVATKRLRNITDTGLTETDTVAAAHGQSIAVTTTGVTQSDSVATQRAFQRPIADTGVSQTDSTSTLRARFISTTGVTQSDSVAPTRGFLRLVSDTGVAQSDSTSSLRVRVVVTTGVSQTDAVAVSVRRVFGVSDTGEVQTDTVLIHFGVVLHPLRAYLGYVKPTAISGLVSGTGLTGLPAT